MVKERMLQKEKEVKGRWMTEEKLKKSGDYSPPLVFRTPVSESLRQSIRAILDYCSKFPSALTRRLRRQGEHSATTWSLIPKGTR